MHNWQFLLSTEHGAFSLAVAARYNNENLCMNTFSCLTLLCSEQIADSRLSVSVRTQVSIILRFYTHLLYMPLFFYKMRYTFRILPCLTLTVSVTVMANYPSHLIMKQIAIIWNTFSFLSLTSPYTYACFLFELDFPLEVKGIPLWPPNTTQNRTERDHTWIGNHYYFMYVYNFLSVFHERVYAQYINTQHVKSRSQDL